MEIARMLAHTAIIRPWTDGRNKQGVRWCNRPFGSHIGCPELRRTAGDVSECAKRTFQQQHWWKYNDATVTTVHLSFVKGTALCPSYNLLADASDRCCRHPSIYCILWFTGIIVIFSLIVIVWLKLLFFWEFTCLLVEQWKLKGKKISHFPFVVFSDIHVTYLSQYNRVEWKFVALTTLWKLHLKETETFRTLGMCLSLP